MDEALTSLQTDVITCQALETALRGKPLAGENKPRVSKASRKHTLTTDVQPHAIDAVLKKCIDACKASRKRQRDEADPPDNASDEGLSQYTRFTDQISLEVFQKFLHYVPRLVNVVSSVPRPAQPHLAPAMRFPAHMHTSIGYIFELILLTTFGVKDFLLRVAWNEIVPSNWERSDPCIVAKCVNDLPPLFSVVMDGHAMHVGRRPAPFDVFWVGEVVRFDRDLVIGFPEGSAIVHRPVLVEKCKLALNVLDEPRCTVECRPGDKRWTVLCCTSQDVIGVLANVMRHSVSRVLPAPFLLHQEKARQSILALLGGSESLLAFFTLVALVGSSHTSFALGSFVVSNDFGSHLGAAWIAVLHRDLFTLHRPGGKWELHTTCLAHKHAPLFCHP